MIEGDFRGVAGLAVFLLAGVANAQSGAILTSGNGGLQTGGIQVVGPTLDVHLTGQPIVMSYSVDPVERRANFFIFFPARPSEVAFSPIELLEPVAPGIGLEATGVKLPDQVFSIPAEPTSAPAGHAPRAHRKSKRE